MAGLFGIIIFPAHIWFVVSVICLSDLAYVVWGGPGVLLFWLFPLSGFFFFVACKDKPYPWHHVKQVDRPLYKNPLIFGVLSVILWFELIFLIAGIFLIASKLGVLTDHKPKTAGKAFHGENNVSRSDSIGFLREDTGDDVIKSRQNQTWRSNPSSDMTTVTPSSSGETNEPPRISSPPVGSNLKKNNRSSAAPSSKSTSPKKKGSFSSSQPHRSKPNVKAKDFPNQKYALTQDGKIEIERLEFIYRGLAETKDEDRDGFLDEDEFQNLYDIWSNHFFFTEEHHPENDFTPKPERMDVSTQPAAKKKSRPNPYPEGEGNGFETSLSPADGFVITITVGGKKFTASSQADAGIPLDEFRKAGSPLYCQEEYAKADMNQDGLLNFFEFEHYFFD